MNSIVDNDIKIAMALNNPKRSKFSWHTRSETSQLDPILILGLINIIFSKTLRNTRKILIKLYKDNKSWNIMIHMLVILMNIKILAKSSKIKFPHRETIN